jgi:hypothetical protein
MNLFAIAIIVLFCLAGIAEHVTGSHPKAIFYYLSAALNFSLLYLR